MAPSGGGSHPGVTQSRCRGRASATELREIVWTEEAVANLDAIANYISAFNPAAAERLAGRLIALADSLAQFPERGHEAGEGRREISLVWPYILRYRVEQHRVLVLRIRHGAQRPD
jgi:plasmid stabilization system protein ParE